MLFLSVLLDPSLGVIILNGAPRYAISAGKHQRKWIIESMIFWSGGVKESLPRLAVASPAAHWSVGSLNLSQRCRNTTRHYSTLLHLGNSLDIRGSSDYQLHFTRAERLYNQKRKKTDIVKSKQENVDIFLYIRMEHVVIITHSQALVKLQILSLLQEKKPH